MVSDKKVAHILSLVIAIIFIILPFHALLTTWVGSNFGNLDALRVWKEIILLASLPLAIVLVWRSSRLRSWLLSSWIARLFAVYLLLHTVGGVYALVADKVNGIALAYSWIINLRFIGFFILCAIAASTSKFLIQNWQKILLLPASAVVVFGLLQRFALPYDFLKHFGYGPDTIPAYQTVDAKLDYRRIQSTLRGANPLGAYLVLIVTALVTVLRKNRLLLLASLAATFIVLFYSYSRSAWIGLGLSLIALIIIEKGKLPGRWILIVGGAALMLFGGTVYSLRDNNFIQDTIFHTSEESTSPQSTNQQRLGALEVGAKDVTEEPLGGGPGTAGPASFRNDGKARIAENYYLQIGQEVGVIGMLIFIAINILVGFELWRRRAGELAKVLLASLVGLTFINLISHAWTDDTLAYLWWGLAGITCAPAILANRQKANGKEKK